MRDRRAVSVMGSVSAGNCGETTAITQGRQLPGKRRCLRTEAKIEVGRLYSITKPWSIHSQVRPHFKNVKTL